ncbi:MAG TPA: two-component system response regulator [Syntrophobacteraceae bacterium]|jgi:two-component system, chemotaxis family, chemotaxis protein CheY|nr:two-component system response regulator [Syntrophobacteraceae bacterium]HBD09923.1 two-component system response regulator [Syntrophobacteraceae bacterium]HBZ55836.1 two-component system response regulator [Syntrophobacteraceae bacterium]
MQRHILFVDDSPTMRASVTFCLRNAGYQVTEAENGLDALEKLKQMQSAGTPPALILTDVNMPEMDGITFITKIKEGAFRFVPVLVLTTEGEKSVIEQGRLAGASGWLLKPFQPEQLLWAIKKLVWPT